MFFHPYKVEAQPELLQPRQLVDDLQSLPPKRELSREFKDRETGDISIARGGAASAAASEGVASERSETRRPEPLVNKKTIRAPTTGVGGRKCGINMLHRFLSPRPASGFRFLFGLYEWFRPPRRRVSRFTTYKIFGTRVIKRLISPYGH